MSKVTLKADELKVAKITASFLTNPVRIHALFALVDTTTGRTMAWSEGEGGLWSNETMTKFRELCALMEEDAARLVSGEHSTAAPGKPMPTGGLAEHLGDVDAPSV